jgi:hypothetical protein
MDKKVVIAICIISILIVPFIPIGKGDFMLTAPAVYIRSPHHASLEVYKNTTITIDIAVTRFVDGPDIEKLVYSLDGHTLKFLDIIRDNQVVDFGPTKTGYIYYGMAVLSLAEGDYTLVAHAVYVDGRTFSNSVDFRIDLDYVPPTVTLLSPLNQTYNRSEIPLVFTVDGLNFKKAHYVLDSKTNDSVSITGNTTLNGLSTGSHHIRLLVDAEVGHITYNTVFTINQTQPNDTFAFGEEVNIIVIVVVGVAIGFVITALLYRRKKQASKVFSMLVKSKIDHTSQYLSGYFFMVSLVY